MLSTNEECVTKLLSQKEIIKQKSIGIYNTNPNFNLGQFLNEQKHSISQWDARYVFIK